jgi:hypothetical protein
MDMWLRAYAQMPDYQIAVFRLKEINPVSHLLLALFGRPDLEWITTDPSTGDRFRLNKRSIRTLTKRTVLGHKYCLGQVGGKLPLLNLGQVTTVQAMVADAEQLGGFAADIGGNLASAQGIHHSSFDEHDSSAE